MKAVTPTRTACGRHPAHGIVLLEVTFALLVVSVGLMAVFTLFPRGLRRAVASDADTQIALFADNVLESLRSAAMQAADDAFRTNNCAASGWTNFWAVIMAPPYAIPSIAGTNLWEETLAITHGILETNIYHVAPSDTHAVPWHHHSLRYSLELDDSAYKHFVAATLSVWPGQHGSTSSVPPCVFYTEYRQPDFF